MIAQWVSSKWSAAMALMPRTRAGTYSGSALPHATETCARISTVSVRRRPQFRQRVGGPTPLHSRIICRFKTATLLARECGKCSIWPPVARVSAALGLCTVNSKTALWINCIEQSIMLARHWHRLLSWVETMNAIKVWVSNWLTEITNAKRTILRRRALSVDGPMAWNALPDDLRDPSLSADKKRLKTHLFRNALGHVAH